MMGASFHDGPDAITVERTACVPSTASLIVEDVDQSLETLRASVRK